MVTVNNSDYYNNIPAGRDLNNLPNTSSAGTTVGYQYDGLTEEDRFVQKVLQEHYDKVYKENLSHSDPMAYIESKYCDVTSPNFCSYMTEDQRSIAYRNEKRMLQTGGKYSAGFARYDYALRNYKDVYTGGSRSVGYVRNTDREKQHARSVVNQQISNLLSKNGISISKQADLVFSIDPYTYQLTVSGNADRDTLSQIEKLLNEGDNAKNIWTHAWICMHDADNEIVNSQANRTKANQYSLWHSITEEVLVTDEVDPGTEKARKELEERLEKRKAEKKETEERLEKQRAEKQEQEERQYNLKIDGKDVADLTGKMVELVGTSIPIGVTESGVSAFDALA